MLFTDIIFIFLERLGYSEQSMIVTAVSETSSDEYGYESTAVLVLGRNGERVIGVFMLSDHDDRGSVATKAAALQKYCQQFGNDTGQYIISHALEAEDMVDAIEFYKCELDGQSSRIDINDFPSYSEMWLMNSLGVRNRKTRHENKRRGALAAYAYFFALIFLVLAVGDIFVEQILDTSYLNTQRALLLVVSVLLLFVPGFLRKSSRT